MKFHTQTKVPTKNMNTGKYFTWALQQYEMREPHLVTPEMRADCKNVSNIPRIKQALRHEGIRTILKGGVRSHQLLKLLLTGKYKTEAIKMSCLKHYNKFCNIIFNRHINVEGWSGQGSPDEGDWENVDGPVEEEIIQEEMVQEEMIQEESAEPERVEQRGTEEERMEEEAQEQEIPQQIRDPFFSQESENSPQDQGEFQVHKYQSNQFKSTQQFLTSEDAIFFSLEAQSYLTYQI